MPPTTAAAETVACAARAHDAADLVLADLAALIEVMRLDHPDPARRVLHRADRCASAVGMLLAELTRFGGACGGTVTLKATARVRRITESFLRDIWACYVVECGDHDGPDDPAAVHSLRLIPEWFGEDGPGTFARYADLIASVFVGEPPAAWTTAVAVQLATAASLFPAANLFTLADDLRAERVALGTCRAERAAFPVPVAAAGEERAADTPPAKTGKQPSRQAAAEIVAAIRRAGRPLQRGELASLSGYRPATVGVYAASMVKCGLLVSTPDGYELPPPPST